MASVSSQRPPSPSSMPMYGGSPVIDLKAGTNNNADSPAPNTSLPRGANRELASSSDASWWVQGTGMGSGRVGLELEKCTTTCKMRGCGGHRRKPKAVRRGKG
jgi:hypothetical protein